MEFRRMALESVVLMLDDTLRNDPTLTPEKKATYNEVINRIRDMERGLYRDIYEMQFDYRRQQSINELQRTQAQKQEQVQQQNRESQPGTS